MKRLFFDRATRACGLAGAVLAALLAAYWAAGGWAGRLPGLLVAPMIGGLNDCLLLPAGARADEVPPPLATCTGPQGSAAPLIDATLAALGPPAAVGSSLELGHTLHVPLLKLLEPRGAGWGVNEEAVQRIARTVRDSRHPLVLYLFSTHFGAHAPIEPVLAADPDNLAFTPQGPMGSDRFYDDPVYPWSVARTDNAITRYRVLAIEAVAEALCRLPRSARSQIRGLTLLGELHHLFPDFQGGMGFDRPYQVSDYSPASVAGFRRFLRSRFKDIATLNRMLGSDFESFEAVSPPSRDIRKEPLQHYWEHLDSYAGGLLPVTGWTYTPASPREAQRVQVYVDGELKGEAPVRLSRQDVGEAHPDFPSADVGWRIDLDHSALTPGIHRIDIRLAQAGAPTLHLGTREISVMDRHQRTPEPAPFKPLPAAQAPGPELQGYIDAPIGQSSYYFNPLAVQWQAFRAFQVAEYLRYFDAVLRRSCLDGIPRFTHQLIPFSNPGWDASKYAVEASLRPLGSMRLGVSLYGEASYGSSFLRWHRRSGRGAYGITEFHPLKAMDTPALRATLDMHRRHGARFLSFFLNARWQGQQLPGNNMFAFDPDNPRFGSDVLYRAMQDVLDEEKERPTAPRGGQPALQAQ